MLDNIYIIKEYNFDSAENHNPVYSDIIGFVSNIEEAQQCCRYCRPKYKGYDGKEYPYRTYQKIMRY